jgi:hypothetical protein
MDESLEHYNRGLAPPAAVSATEAVSGSVLKFFKTLPCFTSHAILIFLRYSLFRSYLNRLLLGATISVSEKA